MRIMKSKSVFSLCWNLVSGKCKVESGKLILPSPDGEGVRRTDGVKNAAFTLAEVLITLGVIGVIAAMTLPKLFNNIQENVKKEQVRTVKYKLTQATDKMKSVGLLQENYPTTMDFVNELKRHYKIAKVCDNSHLSDCWPTDKISTIDGDVTILSLQTGSNLKSLGVGTKNTETVGIVTADGTPIIMTYSPKCSPLEPEKTFSWSTVDNKPETNATTNCISAIFDINGKSGPNRIGKDVRTFNSILGYKVYSGSTVSKNTCLELKKKGLVKGCYYETEYWAGAVKKCNDMGLHLASEQTMTNLSGSIFGISDLDKNKMIVSSRDPDSSFYNFTGTYYWTSTEDSDSTAVLREILQSDTRRYTGWRRNLNYFFLCVAD